ncbi:MAG TPA: hypothetical protein VJQ57_15570 [Acidimicrobiia bacterium]|nr:hypothetical protein [Acidimicrobiia bacterium]
MTAGDTPTREASQAVTVLVLGILSLVVCGILGPIAWKLGNDELAAISAGRRPGENLGMAQAGRICGIVGTCLLGLGLLFLIFWLVLVALGIAGAIGESIRT